MFAIEVSCACEELSSSCFTCQCTDHFDVLLTVTLCVSRHLWAISLYLSWFFAWCFPNIGFVAGLSTLLDHACFSCWFCQQTYSTSQLYTLALSLSAWLSACLSDRMSVSLPLSLQLCISKPWFALQCSCKLSNIHQGCLQFRTVVQCITCNAFQCNYDVVHCVWCM